MIGQNNKEDGSLHTEKVIITPAFGFRDIVNGLTVAAVCWIAFSAHNSAINIAKMEERVQSVSDRVSEASKDIEKVTSKLDTVTPQDVLKAVQELRSVLQIQRRGFIAPKPNGE